MHEAPVRLPTLSVTLILIASVAVVTLIGWASAAVKRALIMNPARIVQNLEVYRLLTGGWLHADVMHLAFNMLTLYFFADIALNKLGIGPFLALYISAVPVAFVPSTLRYMRQPRYSSLGASGAVTAVMFSAILLKPSIRLYAMFIPVPVSGPIYALMYLAFCVWQAFRGKDNVNHTAHFAGAIYGSIFTYAFAPETVMKTLHSFF